MRGAPGISENGLDGLAKDFDAAWAQAVSGLSIARWNSCSW
jgi:hypothetical protein